MKKIHHVNFNQKKTRLTVLISNKVDFQEIKRALYFNVQPNSPGTCNSEQNHTQAYLRRYKIQWQNYSVKLNFLLHKEQYSYSIENNSGPGYISRDT